MKNVDLGWVMNNWSIDPRILSKRGCHKPNKHFAFNPLRKTSYWYREGLPQSIKRYENIGQDLLFYLHNSFLILLLILITTVVIIIFVIITLKTSTGNHRGTLDVTSRITELTNQSHSAAAASTNQNAAALVAVSAAISIRCVV